jgi:hypothetical protein
MATVSQQTIDFGMKRQRIYRISLKMLLRIHRLLGTMMSVLFLIWCLSGFVMMYKDFPGFSRADNLAQRPALSANPNIRFPVSIHKQFSADSVASLRLETVLGQPVFNLTDRNGKLYCFTADSLGRRLVYDTADAIKIVRSYGGEAMAIKKVESIEALDQWIPRTRFVPHFPIHRITLNDKSHTVVYVSSQTGEILQRLNRTDKIWAWLGAIPHWIYFKNLRIHTPAWRTVVIGLSAMGVVLSLAGILLGLQRTRLAHRRKTGLSPYKKQWFRWHHYLGFLFGAFIFTWILSGLFSMNPLQWSPEDALTDAEKALWAGNRPPHATVDSLGLRAAVRALGQTDSVKEIRFQYFNNRLYWVASYANGHTAAMQAGATDTDTLRLSVNDFMATLQTMQPGQGIVSATELTDYDSYYYNKGRSLPLPVYRYCFDDADRTWYYVNPHTVSVVKKSVTRNRFERWVYHGLHSLDFPFLFFKRPLWDITVMLLLLGCTLLSFTGVRLTLKKLVRKWRRSKR